MKTLGTILLFTSTLATTLLAADTPIQLPEVPAPVTKALEDYFPASKPISAKKEVDHGETKFKVLLQYKSITLEAEVLPTGQIVDLDM